MNRDQFLAEIRGAVGTKHTTAHGYTNPYGAQCLAFIAWATELLGYKSIMPGYNAIDVYEQNPLNLPKVSDPQPGDIFFQNMWAMNDAGRMQNFGHTGFVTRVVPGGVYAVAQNARNPSLSAGSPASEDFYPASSMAGYLRPTFKEGGDMVKLNIDALRAINYGFNGRDGRDGRKDARKGEVDKAIIESGIMQRDMNTDEVNEFLVDSFHSKEGAAYRALVDKTFAERDELRRLVKSGDGNAAKTLQAIKDLLKVK
ncbi:CHAP domain-containing protein [Streptomyces turgidiscabies]|uniref:CHAP domain-containing protein n=1 Tax=Streptomyces turgidiscabies TaxID=85558 RepID=UPI0038F5DE8E